MWQAWPLDIDKDIIKIHNNKDVKLFKEDFIDIALKTGRSVRNFEKYDLILKIPVFYTKNRLLYIGILNSHSMIGANQVILGKALGWN